jgi:hypothetical protein
MKDKIYKGLMILLTGLLVLSLVNSKLTTDRLNDDVVHWQNEAAQTLTIETVDSTAIKKLALQVDNLTSENDKINKTVKDQKATIISQVNTIAQLQDSLMNQDTDEGSDVVVGNDTVRTRTFSVSKEAFHLAGWFMIDDPFEINFTNISATIETETNLIENKDGSYQVIIDSKLPGVTITQTIPKVVPYDYKWHEKIKLGVGAYIGGETIGIEGTVGYGKLGIDIGFDSNSNVVLGGKYWIK